MGDTTRWHNEGDGRHNNGKGQHSDMRLDDGDRRQHGDGKGQQGNRRYQRRRATRRGGTMKATRFDFLF